MTVRSPLATAQAIGLPEAAVVAIQQVLASHPEVEAAILYGSRALGRHRPASDIDLTLIGPAIGAAAPLAGTKVGAGASTGAGAGAGAGGGAGTGLNMCG